MGGGGGGLINGLACGEQCRCRTRPCHRQRLVTRQNRPPLRARGYDAVVSRLAVSRVFRGEVAYIFDTDPSTHLSSPTFFLNVVLFFFWTHFRGGKKIRGSHGPQKLLCFNNNILLGSPLGEIVYLIFAETVLPCGAEIRPGINLIITTHGRRSRGTREGCVCECARAVLCCAPTRREYLLLRGISKK